MWQILARPSGPPGPSKSRHAGRGAEEELVDGRRRHVGPVVSATESQPSTLPVAASIRYAPPMPPSCPCHEVEVTAVEIAAAEAEGDEEVAAAGEGLETLELDRERRAAGQSEGPGDRHRLEARVVGGIGVDPGGPIVELLDDAEELGRARRVEAIGNQRRGSGGANGRIDARQAVGSPPQPSRARRTIDSPAFMPIRSAEPPRGKLSA